MKGWQMATGRGTMRTKHNTNHVGDCGQASSISILCFCLNAEIVLRVGVYIIFSNKSHVSEPSIYQSHNDDNTFLRIF